MIYLIFVRNLVLTVLIEGAAVGVIFRRWKEVYYSLLCNLLTNPALNLLIILLVSGFKLPYWPVVAVLEITAVVVEAVVYLLLCDGLTRLKAALLSLGLNGLSFAVGTLLVQ